MPKTDHGGSNSYHKESDSRNKDSDSQHGGSDLIATDYSEEKR